MLKIFVLGLIFFSTAAGYCETAGQARFLMGTKNLDGGDWGNLDSQPEYGLEVDVKPGDWPIWLTAGYLTSQDEATVVTSLSPLATRDIEGKTQEYRVGIKKDFPVLSFLTLAGSGGPAVIRAEMDNPNGLGGSDSGSDLGFWATGDVIFIIGQVGLGFSYRYSNADVDLFGQNRNVGGHHGMFSVGFSW